MQHSSADWLPHIYTVCYLLMVAYAVISGGSLLVVIGVFLVLPVVLLWGLSEDENADD